MKRSMFVLGCLLTALIFFALNSYVEAVGMSSDEADSIKLRLLRYKNGLTVDDLEDGDVNIYLSQSIDGFRAGSGNFIQRGPAGGKNTEETPENIPSPSTYPVKCQFLVVAQVPAGVKEIHWNISGGEADIIDMPEGSKFLAGTHVVTPVASKTISVENTHYAIITRRKKLKEIVGLSYDWKSKLQSKTASGIYRTEGGGGVTVERKEYIKNFRIETDETYIILTSNELGKTTHITASCMGNVDAREATVYASVKWDEQPEALKKEYGVGVPKEYDFTANIVDSIDPHDLEKPSERKVKFKVMVENKSDTTDIPKDLLIFRISPDMPDRNWWSGSDIFQVGRTGAIPAGNTVEIEVGPMTIDVDKIGPDTVKIENTELFFVGPVASNSEDGRVVQTNESTTVKTGPIEIDISGLGTTFDGSFVNLMNQGGFPLWIGSISKRAQGRGIGMLKGERVVNVSATSPVTVEFYVKDKKGNKIPGTVTLRQ